MLKKIAFFNVPKLDFFGFEIESVLARVYCRFAFDIVPIGLSLSTGDHKE